MTLEDLTLKGGKSKSKGLEWQQVPSKWTLFLLLLISYYYTNVGHCAMSNRENIKTLVRYHYTAQETVTSFLTFLEISWFLLNHCYIYHHIICDTTGKVALEVGEIGPWRCFSYFVSWMLESRFKVCKWYNRDKIFLFKNYLSIIVILLLEVFSCHQLEYDSIRSSRSNSAIRMKLKRSKSRVLYYPNTTAT